ncbi:cell envelope integrity protein TolA [Pseudooceanicola aestuarii]|uniref:cell envelope integrity protein TolA n=1 Tax=Pseudooceanicola aestuarii TaxID=2697319 RepID=UPI0013D066FB|nr:energy transducer TonB [Pseudooceanicola aestuarii]
MKADFPLFVAAAVGLHLAIVLIAPEEDGGVAVGGQGGEATATIAAVTPELAALVQEWDTPPDTAEAPDTPPMAEAPATEQPPAPTRDTPAPRVALPDLPRAQAEMPTLPSAEIERPEPPQSIPLVAPDILAEPVPEDSETPDIARPQDAPPPRPQAPQPQVTVRPDRPALPQVDTAPPPSQQAVKRSLRPVERPERPTRTAEPKPRPQPQQARPQPQRREATGQRDSVAQQARKSAGSGGASQAGDARSAGAKAASAAQTQQLMSAWGARIRARIESRKRHPGGRGGRVVLRITVAPSGQVTGAGIAQSSGRTALDRAAITAVQRSGRMPAAPRGLGGGSQSFTLPMNFN